MLNIPGDPLSVPFGIFRFSNFFVVDFPNHASCILETLHLLVSKYPKDISKLD